MIPNGSSRLPRPNILGLYAFAVAVTRRALSGHDLQPEGRQRPRALSATARRYDAAVSLADSRSSKALGLWQEATKIRQEWLDHGLSTQPADRQIAERSLTMIYARVSRPRPRFEWVSSPAQALPLVAGWPPPRRRPLPRRLAPPPAVASPRVRGYPAQP